MGFSHSQVIALWGSVAELAADINQKPDTVRRWKLRNSIPAPFWASLVSAAAQRGYEGVTLDQLASAAPPRGAVGRPFRSGGKPGFRVSPQPTAAGKDRKIA